MLRDHGGPVILWSKALLIRRTCRHCCSSSCGQVPGQGHWCHPVNDYIWFGYNIYLPFFCPGVWNGLSTFKPRRSTSSPISSSRGFGMHGLSTFRPRRSTSSPISSSRAFGMACPPSNPAEALPARFLLPGRLEWLVHLQTPPKHFQPDFFFTDSGSCLSMYKIGPRITWFEAVDAAPHSCGHRWLGSKKGPCSGQQCGFVFVGPDSIYISTIWIYMTRIWPEYDQNWLYTTLCYYRLFSTIARIDLLRAKRSAKECKNDETCGSPLSRCKTSYSSLTKPRDSMLACWTQLAWNQQYYELIRFRPQWTEVNTLEVDPSTTATCFVDRLKKQTEKVKANKDWGDTQLGLCDHVEAWTNIIPGHTRSYQVIPGRLYTSMIFDPSALCVQYRSIPWYPLSSWYRCAAFRGASGLSTSSR